MLGFFISQGKGASEGRPEREVGSTTSIRIQGTFDSMDFQGGRRTDADAVGGRRSQRPRPECGGISILWTFKGVKDGRIEEMADSTTSLGMQGTFDSMDL